MPYTLAFVVRKRLQIDAINELPKEKRPPEKIIWDGSSRDIDSWIDKAFKNKVGNITEISEDDIEE